ncbi:NAD(P)-binding protein, partial [Piedraia hortae CBS 480.64]
MPVYIAAQAAFEGLDSIPHIWTALRALPYLLGLFLLKRFFSGARNTSERNFHGKVVLVTGGTGGVGQAVVHALASRGAQVVVLTQHALSDPFLVDFIDDMRQDTNNHLVSAEQVDLASLHSIRTFATKWIDNSPVRRLDMVVLCGNADSGRVESTAEGIERTWQVNYLANFHLLSILSPALRAQPPDRDVRIIFATCSSYMGGDLSTVVGPDKSKASAASAYATAKLALTTFALAFQKHLASQKRGDEVPVFPHVLLVDPGVCRTPGTRRYITRGSLLGLLLYLVFYPLVWLVLKSPAMGAESFLYAAMHEQFSRGEGGWLIKECRPRDFLRKEVKDEKLQESLWKASEEMIVEGERRGQAARAKEKQNAEK